MEINLGDLGISPAMLARIQAGGGIMGNEKPKGKKKAAVKKAKPGVKLGVGKPQKISRNRELSPEVIAQLEALNRRDRAASPVVRRDPLAGINLEELMNEIGGEGGGGGNYYRGANPVSTPPMAPSPSQGPIMSSQADYPEMVGGGFAGGIGGGPRFEDIANEIAGIEARNPKYNVSVPSFFRKEDQLPADASELDRLRQQYKTLESMRFIMDPGPEHFNQLKSLAGEIYAQDKTFESPYLVGANTPEKIPPVITDSRAPLSGPSTELPPQKQVQKEQPAAPKAPTPPINIMGPSFDPNERKEYEQKIRSQMSLMPGQNIISQNPVTMNPLSAVPQTQFGGYGAQMPMKALNPYAGMGAANKKVDFFPDYVDAPPKIT